VGGFMAGLPAHIRYLLNIQAVGFLTPNKNKTAFSRLHSSDPFLLLKSLSQEPRRRIHCAQAASLGLFLARQLGLSCARPDQPLAALA
jgi:hypothetical protein